MESFFTLFPFWIGLARDNPCFGNKTFNKGDDGNGEKGRVFNNCSKRTPSDDK